MKHAVEIILDLSATFIGSADQQCVDAKTDFAFLGYDNLLSHKYMTRLEGQTRIRSVHLFPIRCLFRLVKCKFTEPLQISIAHIVIITNIQYTCAKCKTVRV